MVRTTMCKKAFTLVELIIAIVIIAMTVLSLPMMSQINSSLMEKNVLQEAVFAAAAQLNEATTYTWDERSTDDSNITTDSRIVNTDTDGCSARTGIIKRQCLINTTTRPSDAASVNGNSINSIAYSTPQAMFVTSGSTASSSYKNDYDTTLIVTRCINNGDCVQFGDSSSDANLKQIEYKVLDANDNTKVLVLLRSYNANIGELTPSDKPL